MYELRAAVPDTLFLLLFSKILLNYYFIKEKSAQLSIALRYQVSQPPSQLLDYHAELTENLTTDMPNCLLVIKGLR